MTTSPETQVAIIRSADEITAEWLSAALGRPVNSVESVSAIGTGQMSQNHRVVFSGPAGSESVVVKLASADETSRGTGVGLGAYYREIAFYQKLAGRIGRPVPACFHAAYDQAEGWFVLVLEDIASGIQGDQIVGCTFAEASLALRRLAAVHAPVFNDLSTGVQDWLNLPNPLTSELLGALLPGFLERYDGRIAPEHVEVCRSFVSAADAWGADRRPPMGLIHGDFRLDNLIFTDDDCAVVDWQTVTWGPAVTDVAYFIGGGLQVADRRAHERELVEIYHQELTARGVSGFTFEQCWEEYRRQVFLGLAMVIGPAMLVGQTDRGDQMFTLLLERVCQQIIDLGSLELLPTAGAVPAALAPAPADEGRHTPGAESAWSESYYFDAVSGDGSIGLYVRLGRIPNQGKSVYTAAVAGPGRPVVMVVDHDAPLPEQDDETQRVETAAFAATQVCESPLQTFAVTLNGKGGAFDDPAAILRGEAGVPVPVKLDLVWHTDGVPYRWRATTRYEVPCRVSGTVTVGAETFEFSGPGQRDHSYGARDWWANDWMWSAFHLEDGTRTHAATVPDLPGFAVGYTQTAGSLTEATAGNSTFEDGDAGLPVAAELAIEPAGTLDVTPVAHAPIRFVAEDGREAHFQRAMATVETPDGIKGAGWIEWNRNQH